MAVKMVFAEPGAGKTTECARVAKRELKKMKKGKSKYKYILSNVSIKGVNYMSSNKIREKLAKGEIPMNALIILDEASIMYNNRMMKMKDKEIEFFKLHRHAKTDIFIISQSFDDVDITLRRLYTEMYLMIRMGPFSVKRLMQKKVGLDEEQGMIIDKYSFTGILSTRITFRPFYYNMFDSYYLPSYFKEINIIEESEYIEEIEPLTERFSEGVQKEINRIKNIQKKIALPFKIKHKKEKGPEEI